MKYLLMFCFSQEHNEHLNTAPPEAYKEIYQKVQSWIAEHNVTSYPRLQPASTATTVRIRDDGSAMVTDGPFVEAKEAIAGFASIEVPDLDEAIRIAKAWPLGGAVEIRPFWGQRQR